MSQLPFILDCFEAFATHTIERIRDDEEACKATPMHFDNIREAMIDRIHRAIDATTQAGDKSNDNGAASPQGATP